MISGTLAYLVDAKIPMVSGPSPFGRWDVYLSAYNDTDRVQHTFERANAIRKVWWLLPEYKYKEGDRVPSGIVAPEGNSEAELIDDGLAKSGINAASGRVGVDITGLLPQHILFLLRRFKSIGLNEFDMVYTEPESYAKRADTIFSMGDIDGVRQISGFGGSHITDMSNDVLIVGVGYDHDLIARVALEKDSARFVQIQCLPSLAAEMYSEGMIRLDRVPSSAHGRVGEHLFFAPANDPFATAAALSSAVASLKRLQPITNLYLSPLATKPQVVGFGLYYLRECLGTAASVIYPFSLQHSRGSSAGVGRTWVYPIYMT